ncbi:bifunctional ADP-dependent NAD(P)H-hydrate dehydratase/NAD(P)H-hydrate epimerase [soil metagenome]
MKVFSSAQLKNWDAVSIREQNISSETLMERAANACYHWLLNNSFTNGPISIFCGKGNNGGDGLALARILLENKIPVTIYILELGKAGSDDFQLNLQKLHQITTDIHFIQSDVFIPMLEEKDLVIDALFGAGLNKPLDGVALKLVEYLNNNAGLIISIDIPTGLYSDKSTKGNTAIKATHTLSFQQAKLAFLFAENDAFVGKFHLLDIGLSEHFEETETAAYEITDASIIKSIIKTRNKFSHKGTYGHASLLAGSYGMMGAAVLAAKGCMYSGAGKLTCYIPACGYDILQVSLPEAMCKIVGEKYLADTVPGTMYDAIGIGPGIGIEQETDSVLRQLFLSDVKTLLADADALNLMAADEQLLSLLPKGSVITPHPREFEKLFGVSPNEFERLELARQKASTLKIYIVLKGHYTAVITPLGKVYFNPTGNAGMAKAGMGDILSGTITGLLAQQYLLPEAALLGVYLHGLAGDIAASKYSQQAMQASNLLECIADAWRSLL